MTPAVTGTQASAADRVRASYVRIVEVERPEVWIHLVPAAAALAAAEAIDDAVRDGDILPLAPDITFAIPEEGFIITCDCLAITSTSRQSRLAHRFIDYLCEPAISAANMKWSLYRAPNRAAYAITRDELKQPILDFLEAPWVKKGTLLPPLAPNDEIRFDKLWDKFKSFAEE